MKNLGLVYSFVVFLVLYALFISFYGVKSEGSNIIEDPPYDKVKFVYERLAPVLRGLRGVYSVRLALCKTEKGTFEHCISIGCNENSYQAFKILMHDDNKVNFEVGNYKYRIPKIIITLSRNYLPNIYDMWMYLITPRSLVDLDLNPILWEFFGILNGLIAKSITYCDRKTGYSVNHLKSLLEEQKYNKKYFDQRTKEPCLLIGPSRYNRNALKQLVPYRTRIGGTLIGLGGENIEEEWNIVETIAFKGGFKNS